MVVPGAALRCSGGRCRRSPTGVPPDTFPTPAVMRTDCGPSPVPGRSPRGMRFVLPACGEAHAASHFTRARRPRDRGPPSPSAARGHRRYQQPGAALAFGVAPGPAERALARAIPRDHLQERYTEPGPGNLYEPSRRSSVRGGWGSRDGRPRFRQAATFIALAGLVGSALLALGRSR